MQPNLAGEDLIFDEDPHFILAIRQFKRRGEELRRLVDDRYKDAFAKCMHTMERQFPGNVDLLERTRSLEEHIRKDLTRKGLYVICQKAESRDLGRVRATLKSGFVNYSAADIEYLRKFGEWEDIPLIIDAVNSPESKVSISLLSDIDGSKFQIAARAIYMLGRTRLPEVLSMSAPSQLLTHIIFEIPDKTFRSISDETIISLLQSEDDSVRKCTALKCVRTFPKKRLVNLLAYYTSSDRIYYNVIHWLDFGVSIHRDRALISVDKILKKEWSH